MTAASTLLARHAPRLRYDSQEVYFADSSAIWTDSTANVLKRAQGAQLAAPPTLKLGYLGAHAYQGTTTAVLSDDVIGETTKDYAKHAAALHANPAYKNKIHARAKRDSLGRLWLQYWCFYYYNDFQLAPFVSGGKHEGDWEMIQIRLDAGEAPVEAVYAQHTHAERRDWAAVPKAGANTPVVFVARGSHASYFSAGSPWTGAWWDNADGKGPAISPQLIELADPLPGWVLWPGFWGDTKATASPIDSSSPRGPVGHAQWADPAKLVQTAQATAALRAAVPPPRPPAAPRITARATDGKLVVGYDAAGAPTALVVGVRPRGSKEPATTYPVAIDKASGEVTVPHAVTGPVDVAVHTAAPGGVVSPAATTRLG